MTFIAWTRCNQARILGILAAGVAYFQLMGLSVGIWMSRDFPAERANLLWIAEATVFLSMSLPLVVLGPLLPWAMDEARRKWLGRQSDEFARHDG